MEGWGVRWGETGQVGAARKLPGMMDTLDNSPLFFFPPGVHTASAQFKGPLNHPHPPPTTSPPAHLTRPPTASLMNCFLPVMERGHKAI